MARYVMANRRARKFREPEKRAARYAIGLALNHLRPAIDIVRDYHPTDELARRDEHLYHCHHT